MFEIKAWLNIKLAYLNQTLTNVNDMVQKKIDRVLSFEATSSVLKFSDRPSYDTSF